MFEEIQDTGHGCVLRRPGRNGRQLRNRTHERQRARYGAGEFILTSGVCDDVVDWATTLAEPNVPLSYNPAYFSDSIHPNAAGHMAMSQAVPLARWFEAGTY